MIFALINFTCYAKERAINREKDTLSLYIYRPTKLLPKSSTHEGTLQIESEIFLQDVDYGSTGSFPEAYEKSCVIWVELGQVDIKTPFLLLLLLLSHKFPIALYRSKSSNNTTNDQ